MIYIETHREKKREIDYYYVANLTKKKVMQKVIFCFFFSLGISIWIVSEFMHEEFLLDVLPSFVNKFNVEIPNFILSLIAGYMPFALIKYLSGSVNIIFDTKTDKRARIFFFDYIMRVGFNNFSLFVEKILRIQKNLFFCINNQLKTPFRALLIFFALIVAFGHDQINVTLLELLLFFISFVLLYSSLSCLILVLGKINKESKIRFNAKSDLSKRVKSFAIDHINYFRNELYENPAFVARSLTVFILLRLISFVSSLLELVKKIYPLKLILRFILSFYLFVIEHAVIIFSMIFNYSSLFVQILFNLSLIILIKKTFSLVLLEEFYSAFISSLIFLSLAYFTSLLNIQNYIERTKDVKCPNGAKKERRIGLIC